MIQLARDLPALADRHGIVLIYAAGIGGHWNDGRADISESARANTDDIGLMRAIIAEEAKERKLLRVGVAGISNGGMMAQRIACEIPELFSLAVTVAANLSVELAQKCKPKSATSVLFIVGVADPIVPYQGGAVKVLRKDRGQVLSIDDSLAFWSKAYSCSLSAEKAFTASSFERSYRCTRGGLRLIAVKDGGHAWPGGMPYLPEKIIGKTTQEFSASEVIVQELAR
jgi:polyhydroxybutyrate depolymerase